MRAGTGLALFWAMAGDRSRRALFLGLRGIRAGTKRQVKKRESDSELFGCREGGEKEGG